MGTRIVAQPRERAANATLTARHRSAIVAGRVPLLPSAT